MRKGEEFMKYVWWTTVVIFIVALVTFGGPHAAAQAGDNPSSYIEKATKDAKRARSEAEQAMAEAEKAMDMAARAKAEAEAKEKKVDAMKNMVEAGYFPADIAMTTPESKTVAVFSHKKHTERERLRCIDCHPRVFIMKVGKNVVKKGQLTMSEMKKGKYCGNCHDGSKAFSVSAIDSCHRCHPTVKK